MNYGEKKQGSAPRQRPRRSLRPVAIIALACAVVLAAAACTVHESKQYVVQLGRCTIFAHIFRAPTKQILDIYEANGRDVNRTADILQRLRVSGWGAAEWNQALRKDRASLKDSLEKLRASRQAGQDKCLMLRKDVCWPNFGNTSFRVSDDSAWCKVGEPFKP